MSHARIAETYWTDPKIRRLSPEGKLLFLYLLSNPHRHYSGLYYLPIELIPIETGLKGDTVNKELNTLINCKILLYDTDTETIFIRKMFLYQSGGEAGLHLTDKQKTGVVNHLKTLHRTVLIETFLKVYKGLGLKMGIPIETPFNADWHQSQSQSQSQSQEKLIAPPGPSDAGGAPRVFFFSCQFFDVDFDHRMKLAKEFPALTDDLLKSEFSKMEDWIVDNKHKKKFKANGHLGNPRTFITNWLKKVEVNGQRLFGVGNTPKGYQGLRDYAQGRIKNAK